MDFAAFVLLNAVLFIRPMEFVPGLYGLPLYNVTFCLCMLLSLQPLMQKGTLSAILYHPIGLCVLGVTGSAVVSNLVGHGVQDAFSTFDVMLKLVLYYILLNVVVRTPARLKWFMASMVLDACVVAALGVADYKGYIKVPNLPLIQEFKYVGGEAIPFRRLSSTGLFGDPNDLGQFLVISIVFSLYLASDRASSLSLRMFWLLPLAPLFQALLLTFSRAGMLSLLVAGSIYAVARFGVRATAPIGLALPAVLGIGGRQLDFSLSGGTGQDRVVIWDLFLNLFIRHPLLGVGYDHCLDHSYYVAHNSYLHAYGELGFIGGTAFLGAFVMSLYTLLRIGPLRTQGLDPVLARLWPVLLATVGCYALGIMSLSRCYVAPTYSTLGMVAAYERMALAGSSRKPLRFGAATVALMLAVSVLFICGMYVIIRRNANYYQ